MSANPCPHGTEACPCESDAEARRALEFADKATPGPWQTRFLYRIMAAVRRHAKRLGLLVHADRDQEWANAEFCAEMRTIGPVLARQVLTLIKKLRAGREKLGKSEAKREELEALFDLQHNRTREADRLWQEAHNEPLTLPDLGRLIDWLLERATMAEQQRLLSGYEEKDKK